MRNRRMLCQNLLTGAAGALLAACGAPIEPSFDAARQTAILAGCWPGNRQTPLPVTVTPLGGFVATAAPALPSPTALPSSTPYPRCTPAPAEPTLRPYPTPAPTRPPYPTRAAFQSAEGETATTILHVPETILSVDLAVHPTANWPTVVAVAASLTTQADPRAIVRVFDPTARRWRDALSLGGAAQGLARTRFRTVQIGIAGDGTIHVVWGVVRVPQLGLLAARSHDYGTTWSIPTPIASRTYGVLDMAVAPDGSVAALAISEASQQPILIRCERTGGWLSPEPIPVPAWYGSRAALALVETKRGLEIVAVTTGGGEQSPDNTLFLVTRPYVGGSWTVARHSVPSPDDRNPDLLTNLRAVQLPDRHVLFSFAMAGRAASFSLVGGSTGWGQVEMVANPPGKHPPFLAAAADPITGQALLIQTCCGDASFISAASAHLATWGMPAAAGWSRPFPLVSGAAAAADTVIAQAPGAQVAWLAWVEDVHRVQVRSLDLRQIGGRA